MAEPHLVQLALLGRVPLDPREVRGDLRRASLRCEHDDLPDGGVHLLDNRVKEHPCTGVITADHHVVVIAAHSDLLLSNAQDDV